MSLDSDYDEPVGEVSPFEAVQDFFENTVKPFVEKAFQPSSVRPRSRRSSRASVGSKGSRSSRGSVTSKGSRTHRRSSAAKESRSSRGSVSSKGSRSSRDSVSSGKSRSSRRKETTDDLQLGEKIQEFYDNKVKPLLENAFQKSVPRQTGDSQGSSIDGNQSMGDDQPTEETTTGDIQLVEKVQEFYDSKVKPFIENTFQKFGDSHDGSEGGKPFGENFSIESVQDFFEYKFVPFMKHDAVPLTKEYSVKSFKYSRDVILPFVKEQTINGYHFTVETGIPYFHEVVVPTAKQIYDEAWLED